MPYRGPTQHQDYQALPKLDTPLIDGQGNISIPWYRWFISVWQRTGSAFSNGQTAAVVSETTPGTLIAYNALSGQPVGEVVTTGSPIIIININNVVNSASAFIPPEDQARPQKVPTVPLDQFRIQHHYGTVMDQANMANAINHVLALGQ